MQDPFFEPETDISEAPLRPFGRREERSSPAPPRNGYAALIETCRRGARLSREAIGKRIGVPEATIRLWEDPAYEGIDLSILERVARASGRDLQVSFVRSRTETATVSEPAPRLPLERTA